MKILKNGNPEASYDLKVRSQVGRPRLDVNQPALLSIICDIAEHSGSADFKGRSEVV